MGLMKPALVLILYLFVPNTEASPLFEESSDQPLVVEIQTNLYKIKNSKSDFHTSTNNYINGRFKFKYGTFDIKLQTRGHDRLAKCSFPPLKIYFDKSGVKKSPLKHNHELKLVTHCQDDRLNFLFREHLIYKIYNLITPYSFHVRLLKIKYIDIDRNEDTIESYAFLIESCKSVEKRLNLDELKSDDDFNLKSHKDISENWLNVSQTKLQEAFQHLIRNNDQVIFYTETTRTFSLANIKFFHNKDEGFPIPYDFDLAGVVTWDSDSFEYRFGNENVCESVEFKEAVTKLLNLKSEYLQLIDEDSFLSLSYKSKLIDYLIQFRSVADFCLGMEGAQTELLGKLVLDRF